MLSTHAAGLGCKLVLVLGATSQIDNYLHIRGLEARFVGGYRVTDEVAMLAAMEAAGTSRVLVESHLSKVAPSCSLLGSTVGAGHVQVILG